MAINIRYCDKVMYKWWKDPTRKEDIANKISKKLLGKKRPRNFNTIFKFQFIIKRRSRCWEFTGRLNPAGYGQKRYMGKTHGAHRLSYELHYGKIKDSTIFVCHKCDNRKCINPEHLWLGTCHENFLDMMYKNRGSIATLSKEQREEIKKLYFDGMTIYELRKKFCTTNMIIDYIINYSSYIPPYLR